MRGSGLYTSTQCSASIAKVQPQSERRRLRAVVSHFKQVASVFAPPLQVQTLRLPFCLRLHNILPSAPEVCHVDPHASFSQCPQTSFAANRLDVGTTQIILLRDEFIEIDVIIQAHLAGVKCENLLLRVRIWVLEQNLSVDSTGSNQSGIQSLNLLVAMMTFTSPRSSKPSSWFRSSNIVL